MWSVTVKEVNRLQLFLNLSVILRENNKQVNHHLSTLQLFICHTTWSTQTPHSKPTYWYTTHYAAVEPHLIFWAQNHSSFNPLKPELNPICYLLALLGDHHFLHVSRIRVKSLTLRRLMSYIYRAPILDVSRSHTTTQHSR